jgi:hypothetical protein
MLLVILKMPCKEGEHRPLCGLAAVIHAPKTTRASDVQFPTHRTCEIPKRRLAGFPSVTPRASLCLFYGLFRSFIPIPFDSLAG